MTKKLAPFPLGKITRQDWENAYKNHNITINWVLEIYRTSKKLITAYGAFPTLKLLIIGLGMPWHYNEHPEGYFHPKDIEGFVKK